MENKEEIDAWRRNTIDAMPPDSLGEVEELSVKLAHAEAKLEGRKSERDVSLAELAAKQLAEKIVKPESQDKAAGKKRTDMQEARSASGCKEQKVQEALTRCNKALGKGTASLQGERQEPQQEEKNEKGFAGKLKSMLLRKLKGNSGH